MSKDNKFTVSEVYTIEGLLRKTLERAEQFENGTDREEYIAKFGACLFDYLRADYRSNLIRRRIKKGISEKQEEREIKKFEREFKKLQMEIFGEVLCQLPKP